MPTKRFILIFSIIILIVVLEIGLYFWLSSKNKKVSQRIPPSPKKSFDFQIVLPKESVYKLTQIKDLEVGAERASSIWFKNSEKVNVSSLGNGGFRLTEPFLSQKKPFGQITVTGTQTKGDKEIYLRMSAYVFYQPFVEKFKELGQGILNSYLWPSGRAIVVDSRSTAISCLLNDYLTFSGLPSKEEPFTYHLPSSEETLSVLPELLSHPKFPVLRSEVEKLLVEGLDSPAGPCFEEKVGDITSEILRLNKKQVPSKEDINKKTKELPQTKDAEIVFQLGQQLKMVAFGMENFDKLNIENPSVKEISDKIAENGGKLIIQKPSSPAYEFCAYSPLNQRKNGLPTWYCVDSSGQACYLTTDPSATCNSNSYTCSCNPLVEIEYPALPMQEPKEPVYSNPFVSFIKVLDKIFAKIIRLFVY